MISLVAIRKISCLPPEKFSNFNVKNQVAHNLLVADELLTQVSLYLFKCNHYNFFIFCDCVHSESISILIVYFFCLLYGIGYPDPILEVPLPIIWFQLLDNKGTIFWRVWGTTKQMRLHPQYCYPLHIVRDQLREDPSNVLGSPIQFCHPYIEHRHPTPQYSSSSKIDHSLLLKSPVPWKYQYYMERIEEFLFLLISEYNIYDHE